jgi:protein-S-isoprenylcysteine O-methyltransferase Ste14
MEIFKFLIGIVIAGLGFISIYSVASYNVYYTEINIIFGVIGFILTMIGSIILYKGWISKPIEFLPSAKKELVHKPK